LDATSIGGGTRLSDFLQELTFDSFGVESLHDCTRCQTVQKMAAGELSTPESGTGNLRGFIISPQVLRVSLEGGQVSS